MAGLPVLSVPSLAKRGRGALMRVNAATARLLHIAEHPSREQPKREGRNRKPEETAMSVARVTEITAASPESFEAAVRLGIERASKTLKNIRSAWVQEQTVAVSDDGISEVRVNMKVTFILED